VIDVVGAATPNETFSDVGIGAGRSIDNPRERERKSGHVEGVKEEVSAISGKSVEICCKNDKSSGVRPEKVITSKVSRCIDGQASTIIVYRGAYSMDQPEIPVKGLGRVEKDAHDPEAVHCCDHFLPNPPTLTNARDYEFSSTSDGCSDGGNGIGKSLLSVFVRFV